jgi:hypothetical protein
MDLDDLLSAAAAEPSARLTDAQLSARVRLADMIGRSALCDHLGINSGVLSRQLRRAAARGVDGSTPGPAPEGFEVTHNTGTFDADGNLTGQVVKTKRENGDPFEMLPGHFVKGESAFVDAEGRVIAKWIKTARGLERTQDLLAALQGAFQDIPRAPIVTPPTEFAQDLLNLLPIADLHLGLYSWRQETGADFDLQIAERLFRDVFGRLVMGAPQAEEMVILGLGDFTHANDDTAKTKASGNVLDVDSRHDKVILLAVRLMVWLINLALSRHPKVTVRILKGNHDPEASVALAVALAAHFEMNERVNVVLSPSMVWFYRWGEVGIAGFHGHTFKPDRIFPLWADYFRRERQVPTNWTRSYRGHIHHETALSDGHNKVESIQTITAPDAWHAGAGYISDRAARLITHHRLQPDFGSQTISIAPTLMAETAARGVEGAA